MSMSKSSSSTTPGYADLYTDPKVQYMDQMLYGSGPYQQAGQWSPKGFAGGSGYKWNPANEGGTYGGAALPGSTPMIPSGGNQPFKPGAASAMASGNAAYNSALAGGRIGDGNTASGGGGYLFGGGGGGTPMDQKTIQAYRDVHGKDPAWAAQPQSGGQQLTLPMGQGGGGSQGYLGQLFQNAGQNNIFKNDGGAYNEYSPYTDTLAGSQYNFKQPTLGETKLTPEEYSASQDMITKNARRVSQGNIDKMREADQYRGAGDLADYKAARENRNVNESTADSLRGLSEDYQKRLFEDRQGVGRYNADANQWAQQAQAGEAGRYQDYQASQKAAQEQSRQFGEQSNQFGKQYQSDYMKNQLAEQAQNTSSLQELLKIMSGRSEAFAEKPSSTSKSKGFGMG